MQEINQIEQQQQRYQQVCKFYSWYLKHNDMHTLELNIYACHTKSEIRMSKLQPT